MASYGPAIVDGIVQYFSATSLQTGDARTDTGCELKYYYQYVERRQREDTDALRLGIRIDDEITRYVQTGEKNLGPLALTALPLIPPLGPSVTAQQEIRGVLKIGTADVVGKIDLLNVTGVHYTLEGAVQDPDGTIEILDWKSVKDLRWAKTSQDLIRTVQMVIYGMFAIESRSPEYVRLSHGYIRTKGERSTAHKVTDLISPERFLRPWRGIEELGERLAQVAKETSPNAVEPNLSACGAFGGCPHRAYCRAANFNSLKTQLGDETAMSILNKLNLNQPTDAVKAAEQALLEREVPAAFRSACAVIDQYQAEYGWPALAGEAARLRATMLGQALQGQGVAGSGKLSQFTLTTQAEVEALAADLVKQHAEADPVAPPDVPAPSTTTTPATEEPARKPRRKKDADPPAPAQPDGVTIYIDAIPSFACASLDPYVRGLCKLLEDQTGVADIRMAPDGALGFGKWKGVLAALARANPPAPGSYTAIRPDEITEVVCNALSTTVTLVIGVR